MGPKLRFALSEWSDLVTESIRRVLGDTPLANLAPAEQLGQGMSALLLGIELLADLDPEKADVDALLDTLLAAASMVWLVLADGLTPPAASQNQKQIGICSLGYVEGAKNQLSIA